MNSDWLLLLAAALIGSIVSLIGGVLLLVRKISVQKVQRIAIPFAAGALLAAAFVDLLPEAIEKGGPHQIALYVLGGFLVFFVLERFLGWFHHHHSHSAEVSHEHKVTRSLIIVGDTVHNFIDGLALGAAFLADPALGFVTAVAIAAHEIPQEVGDFGVLLSLGMRRRNVLIVNFLSALATIVGAFLVYGLGSGLVGLEPLLLAGTVGFFIYIAASDLIPTIHSEPSIKTANLQTLIVLIGIVIVGASVISAHGLLPEEDHASSTHQVTR